MSATDDEVEQLLRRTRAARERCNNRMALIGNNQISFKGFYERVSCPTSFNMIHTLPQLSYISGESGHPIRSPLQERNVNLEKSALKQSRSPIKVTIKQ